MFDPTSWGLTSPALSEAERKLSSLVKDESVHVLNTLQLHQLASYSYHETNMTGGRSLAEKMLDVLEPIMVRPIDNSVLTLQKSLVVLRHLLLYGSDRLLQPARTLGPLVQQLCTYNTVLAAQKALEQEGHAQASASASVTGFWMYLKGGGVDTAGPVREAAQRVFPLLADPRHLQFERAQHADPDSLVPANPNSKIAFLSDQARWDLLKRRIQREEQLELRSNLAKSDSAFGSGYTAKDGKTQVVGAAHSLEEMIAHANRRERKERSKFSDEPPPPGSQQSTYEGSSFADYRAPGLFDDPFGGGGSSRTPAPTPVAADLLSLDDTRGVVGLSSSKYDTTDLLGFAATTTKPNPPQSYGQSATSHGNVNLFSPTANPMAPPPSNDLLGGLGATTSTTASTSTATTNFLNFSTGASAPTATAGNNSTGLAPSIFNPSASALPSGAGALPSSSSFNPPATTVPLPGLSSSSAPTSTAGSMATDRFAALDALADAQPSKTAKPSTTTTGSSSAFSGLVSPESLSAALTPPVHAAPAAPAPGWLGASTGVQPTAGPSPSWMGGSATPVQPSVVAPPTSLPDMSSLSIGGGIGGGGGGGSMNHYPAHSSMGGLAPTATSSAPPLPPSAGPAGALRVSTTPFYEDDDGGGGFVMGGAVGTGLEPLGPAPAGPPPPPPPTF